MYIFAEAICILLRLYAGLCENIDHLSPAETRAGTELGKKNILKPYKLVKVQNLHTLIKILRSLTKLQLQYYSNFVYIGEHYATVCTM